MKTKFINVVLVGVLLFTSIAFSSCNDALIEEPFGNPTTEEMLQNEENFILLVGQVYSEMKWLHDHWGYWGLNTLSADEAMCPLRNPGAHWSDSDYWQNLSTHEWDANGKAFKNVWETCNAGAVLCNKVLAQLESKKDDLDPALYDRFVAELKVVRAYYYYTLFDCFGRIPYSESFEIAYVPQSTPEEVWERLVSELEENTPKLPVANVPSKAANYGRVTQGLGNALLARLYLNAESYDVSATKLATYDVYNKCITACDRVIDSEVYQIEPNFFTNFAINNENSKENIFVIVENGNANFDYRDIPGKMANKLRITMLTLHYSHQQLWGLLEKPWNGFCAPEDFISKYAPEDVRGLCDASLGTNDTERRGWFVGPVYDKNGNIAKDENGVDVVITSKIYSGADYAVPATSITDVSWNSGARLLKYEVEKNSTINKYCENDFVLFRYADVLYMKAEAILRGGTGSLSDLLDRADFQLIRTRANLTPYTVGTLTLEELYNERGREFAWENVRRRDMIRFGTFINSTWQFKTITGQTYRKWFPINKEILGSEPRWTQNAGYVK